jgi:DNA-binding transcriptional LysR family regulator
MGGASLDLRIADVLTVLAVARSGSVSIAAKERSVTPSQVSKAIQRVARVVGHELFVRRGASFVLSDAGHERIAELRGLAAMAQRLTEERVQQRLTVAMPSFLCSAFSGLVANAIAPRPMRVLGLGQRSIQAHASSAFFEIALSAGPLALPETWSSVKLFDVRFGFLTTPQTQASLGEKPTLESIAKQPFVLPILMTAGEIVPGDDGCPIPRDTRIRGDEADTIGAALDLITSTNHVVFGPLIAAKPWLASGALVQIEGDGFEKRAPLFLHVHGDRVTGQVQRRIVSAISSQSEWL